MKRGCCRYGSLSFPLASPRSRSLNRPCELAQFCSWRSGPASQARCPREPRFTFRRTASSHSTSLSLSEGRERTAPAQHTRTPSIITANFSLLWASKLLCALLPFCDEGPNAEGLQGPSDIEGRSSRHDVMLPPAGTPALQYLARDPVLNI